MDEVKWRFDWWVATIGTKKEKEAYLDIIDEFLSLVQLHENDPSDD